MPAADVFYSSNPSVWNQLPGLYIAERPPAAFIRGRDVSIVGFASKTVRGPKKPILCTSVARFLQVYGGRAYTPGGVLVNEAWKALLAAVFNGVVIRRVYADDATLATHNFSDVTPTAIIRVDAATPGAWANGALGSIEAASDGVANHFNLRMSLNGLDEVFPNLNVFTSTDDNLVAVVGTDDANKWLVTKLASGRPLNVANAALTAATDGALDASEYVAGITDLSAADGPAVCLVPEAGVTTATVNGALVSLAASANDRIFLGWSGVHGQTPAQEVTAVNAQITTRRDRIEFCYNSPQVYDPEANANIDVAPHVVMASIKCQNDVDVHSGAFETRQQTAKVRSLRNEALTRGDLISLRNAGISTLEKLSGGFQFRDSVTTDLTPGLTEMARRREVDFLVLSIGDSLRAFVKAKNTIENRTRMGGAIVAFLQGLRRQTRIVEDFQVDQVSVNTAAQRARGEEHILVRIKLIGHMLYLVLEVDASTGTVIERAA